MQQLTINEAAEQLPALIEAAVRGEEVLITRDATHSVQLVPRAINGKRSKRQYGSAKGMIEMAPDFDAPLDDFKEYAT